MTETELVSHYLEILALIKEDGYWFFSATFGLYSVAYVVGKKMTLGSVIFVIVAYIALLVSTINEVLVMRSLLVSILNDLMNLERQGAELSNLSQRVVEILSFADLTPVMIGILSIAPLAASLGGVGYLLSQSRQGRKMRT